MRRPARPNRRRNSASAASRSMTSASAGASSGGTGRASTPARAISRQPGTSVATIADRRPRLPAGSSASPRAARQYGDMLAPRTRRCRRRGRGRSAPEPASIRRALRDRSGICRIGLAGDEQGDGWPRLEAGMGRDQRRQAFVLQQPADKGDGAGAAVPARRQRVDVDAGAGNQCDSASPTPRRIAARSSGFCTSTALRLRWSGSAAGARSCSEQ